MKMTLATMEKLAKNIERSSGLCSNGLSLREHSNEFVLSFRDLNNILISCYSFKSSDIFQIVYHLNDDTPEEVVKWYGDIKLSQFNSVIDFMFHIGIKLRDVTNYISDYVL